MKLIISFAAAAALTACSQTNQDNMATGTDANLDASSGESVLPVEDNAAGSDTLGNQLNQLDGSGNATESADSADEASENSVNSY